MKTTLVHILLGCLGTAIATATDLTTIADSTVWRIHNREAKLAGEGGKTFVRLDARKDHGMAWLVGSDFKEGTIDVDLRGKNKEPSFIGIAFRGVDDTTYDAVYFRPFNFKSADPARRLRAVQYLSRPDNNWDKLRKESPGKYEQPVSPVPDPDDGWFHARIVIEGGKVSVFVNESATPSLVVNELTQRRGGMVGLWVDNYSSGDFANLRLTPKGK